MLPENMFRNIEQIQKSVDNFARLSSFITDSSHVRDISMLSSLICNINSNTLSSLAQATTNFARLGSIITDSSHMRDISMLPSIACNIDPGILSSLAQATTNFARLSSVIANLDIKIPQIYFETSLVSSAEVYE